ncbi:unnamed protein product [Danaus chrysippus]|uniref:(African queen) hypothetical protein n=1 Tax=Danaus chrysippus TaxID=151541 RepID=A0A8J2W1T3_9NEOP|nr:unnamed protein product [Danaus chrysippus]
MSLNIRVCAIVIFIVNIVNGDVIVETTSGKVAGREVESILPNEKYYSFLGIPYAKPPTDKLRFMPPVPHPAWDDILPTKVEKKQCSQFNLPLRNLKQYGYFGDENCLHLSIHTPKEPINNNLDLPVIVFLHNDHFKMSYNGTKSFGPDFLMKENVILVTISHRLGSLGFLAFEDKLLPGNNGIRDVVLALNWIKDNIKNFGGDPSKVTLMGHKAGAVIVDILLHSPKGKDLFSGVILQSETSFSSMYFDEHPKKRAIELSDHLEQKATTSESLLQRLSDVPALKLTEAELYAVHADEPRSIQRGIVPFGPVVESENPESIISMLPESNKNDLPVPIMIGFNSREGIALSSRYLHNPNYLTYADKDFLMLFPIRVGYTFKLHDKLYEKAVQEIKDFYFDEGYVKVTNPSEYITYMGDVTHFYHIDYTVRTYANISSKPIYYYMFDYSGELNFRKKSILEDSLSIEGTWGASGDDDLCYVFVCHPYKKVYKKILESDDSEELKVLQNMVKYITNFAKTGNPTPPGSPINWKPVTKENRQCLIISEEPRMQNNIYEDKVSFWDNFIEKYRQLAVDGVVKDVHEEL